MHTNNVKNFPIRYSLARAYIRLSFTQPVSSIFLSLSKSAKQACSMSSLKSFAECVRIIIIVEEFTLECYKMISLAGETTRNEEKKMFLFQPAITHGISKKHPKRSKNVINK